MPSPRKKSALDRFIDDWYEDQQRHLKAELEASLRSKAKSVPWAIVKKHLKKQLLDPKRAEKFKKKAAAQFLKAVQKGATPLVCTNCFTVLVITPEKRVERVYPLPQS